MRPPPRLQLFRGFLSLPLVRQATAASLLTRPLFLSSSFPLFLTNGSACINKCARVSPFLSLSPLRLLLRSLHFFPLSVDWTTFFFPIVFLGQSFRLRLFSVVSRVSFFFSFFEGCMRVTILESIGSMFEQCNSVIVLCINVPVKNNSYFHEFFRIIYFNIEARK